jgi:hypothetical protein
MTTEERNARVVALVTAPGSCIYASRLNPGCMVVIDGRSGLDACGRSVDECFDILFAEEDGGPSPGRLYITVGGKEVT